MLVQEGSEHAFEETWAAVAPDIARFPGNLGQTLLRDIDEPRRYLITSDWITQDALRAFECSATRQQLSARLDGLRESARKDVLSLITHLKGAKEMTTGPVRVMVSTSVAPEDREAFESAYAETTRTVAGTPGHIRDELLRDAEGEGYTLLAEWQSEEFFRAWEDAPVHREMAAPLYQFFVKGGFERRIFHVAASAVSRPGPMAASSA